MKLENSIYKCPYCNQTKSKFKSWKIVRAHASNCDLNTRKYIFCEYYGPILIESISSLRMFRKQYPKTSLHYSVFANLRKQNKSNLRYTKCDKIECIKAIQDFYNQSNNIPQIRTFKSANNSFYPSVQTIINLFGSWNQAISESGFKPDYTNNYGIPTKAKDNKLYRSKLEARFVDEYLFEKHSYEYAIRYPKPYNKYYDFYLPEWDLYIEIDGNLRPEVMQEKIQINIKLNRNLLVINTKNWDNDINEFLKITKE